MGAGTSTYFLKNTYLLESFVVTLAANENFKNESVMVLPATQGRDLYEVTFSQSNLEQRLKSAVRGRSIFFRISSKNKVGISLPSPTVNSKMISIPSSPLGLGISFQGGGVLLTWALPAETGIGNNAYPVANYFVEIDKNNFSSCASSVSSCFSVKLITGSCSCWQVESAFLRFRPMNLIKGELYWFRVFAKNDAGFGPPSFAISARALELPRAPLSFEATLQQTARNVFLSWAPPPDFGFGNGILNNTGGGMYLLEYTVMFGFEIFKSMLVLGNSAALSGLRAGSIYYMRVAALNFAGLGSFSPTLQVEFNIDAQMGFSYRIKDFLFSASWSEHAVMVRNGPKYNANEDQCLIIIQGVIVKANAQNQIPEGCGRSQFFRTVFNFTVPAIYSALPQSSVVAASVSIVKSGQSLSCGVFPYRLLGLAQPTIKFLVPSIGPVSGGTLVAVGIDGFPQPFSPEDLDMFVNLSPTRNITMNAKVIDGSGTVYVITPSASAGTYSIFFKHRQPNYFMVLIIFAVFLLVVFRCFD
jgi:hypothetical protein